MLERVLHLWSYKIFQAIIAGICIGIGLLIPSFWFIAFFGLFIFIRFVIYEQRIKALIAPSYIVGLLASLFTLSAVTLGVFPFDWFGINTFFFQALAVGVTCFLAAAVLASSYLLFAIAVFYLKTNTWYDIFLLPSLWLLGEWIDIFLLFIVQFGPGSFGGPHFTMGWIGYVLASDSIFLQFAWFGGVYLLSFLAISLVVLFIHFCDASHTKTKQIYGLVLLIIFSLWAIGHVLKYTHVIFRDTPSSKTLSVAVVSRYMPPQYVQSIDFQRNRFQEMLQLIAPLRNIDLLVFAENTTFLRTIRIDNLQLVRDELLLIGRDHHSPAILDSEDVKTTGDVLHSQSILYRDGTEENFAQKQFLLPFGEYIPYLYRSVFMLMHNSTLLRTIERVRGYQPGINNAEATIKGVVIVNRFCDEVMSPELFRTQVADGAQILVNMSSLSWFHGSVSMYDQMLRIAKVRAVENGRFLVQSGNMAPAFILNQYGDVVRESVWGHRQVVLYDVPARTNMTPYVLFGHWFIVLCCLMIALRFLFQTNKIKKIV